MAKELFKRLVVNKALALKVLRYTKKPGNNNLGFFKISSMGSYINGVCCELGYLGS